MKENHLERLFERFRRDREPADLAALFDRTAPELFRVALHLAPDITGAEDLVQETFLALLQGVDRFRSGAPFLPWLFGILANRARKARRAAARLPDPERLRPRPAPDPVAGVAARETVGRIGQALAGLPQPYREVLEAFLGEGRAPASIAARFARSPGTVRSQIHRGLELLRRGLPAGLAPGVVLLPGRGLPAIREEVLARCVEGSFTASVATTMTLGGLIVKKTLSLALGAALLAGTLFYLLPSTREDSTFTDPAAPPPGKVAARRHDRDRTTPPAKGRTPLAEAAPPAGTGVPTRPLPPNLALADLPAGGAWTLEVVGADGRPRPGARVAWLFATPGDHVQPRLEQGEVSVIDLIFHRGRRAVADAAGRVAVPRVPFMTRLAARHGDLEGVTRFHPENRTPHRLRLHPRVEVRIAVHDPQGRPCAGVPVRLFATGSHQRECNWQGVTAGPEGAVTARVTPAVLADPGGEVRLFAGFRPPLLSLEDRPVDRRGSRVGVTLALPPCGRVELTVRDREGGVPPADHPATVTLRREGSRPVTFTTLVRAGQLVLPYVSLGLAVEIALDHPGLRGHSAGVVRGRGPVVAGERVALHLTLTGKDRLVRARAVDGESRPLARRLLVAREPGGYLIQSGHVLRTDAEGRFTLPPLAEKLHLILWERTDDRGAPRGPVCRLEVPLPLPDPGVDLGDLVFRPDRPDLLLTGVVVDDLGRPLSKPGLIVLATDSVEGRPRWKRGGHLRVEYGEAGAFSILGRQQGRLGLMVMGTSHIPPANTVFPVGARDVRIVMRRAGRLAVTIRGDTPFISSWVYPRLALRDPRVRPTVTREGPGRFLIRGVPPGTYRVDILSAFSRITSVEGVEVKAGEACGDPRLQPVDVTGLVRQVDLRVVDPGGTPIDRPTTVAMVAGGAYTEVYRKCDAKDGRVRVLLPRQADRLLVTAKGRRAVVLHPGGGEPRKVVLAPELGVQVSVPGAAPGVRARLLPRASSHQHLLRHKGWLRRLEGRPAGGVGRASVFAFGVPAPGEYRLELYTGGRRGAPLRVVRTHPIRVVDRSGVQEYAVPGSS